MKLKGVCVHHDAGALGAAAGSFVKLILFVCCSRMLSIFRPVRLPIVSAFSIARPG